MKLFSFHILLGTSTRQGLPKPYLFLVEDWAILKWPWSVESDLSRPLVFPASVCKAGEGSATNSDE